MTQYLPTDRWPKHPKSYFDEVFKKARAYGWSLTEHSSHPHYRLECPTGACSYVVYKTGRAGESAAKSIGRSIERCPHGAGTVDAVERAVQLLDQAQRLLDAAERLLASAAVGAQAETLFDEAPEEALQFIEEAESREAEAAALLDGELAGAGPSEVIAESDSLLSRARDALLPHHEGPRVAKLQWERLVLLRERCEDLKRRIPLV